MEKKLLAVSRQQDRINAIVVDKKGAGLFAGEPVDLSSKSALNAACRSVDEIYITDPFLSAVYIRDHFPKVKTKHLFGLLNQDAAERFAPGTAVNTVFKPCSTVLVDGVERQEIAYICVENEKVAEVWAIFEPFQPKIKAVTPLASALASLVARNEETQADFIIAQLGVEESVILVSSAQGEVKVVRNLALGTSDLDADDPQTGAGLSQRVDKEINRTINFFKQEFRAGAPERIFIFGHGDLTDIFEATPLSLPDVTLNFALSQPLIVNYPPQLLTENIHIISSIFADGQFNFIPEQMMAQTRIKKIFYPVYMLLSLIICAMLIWCGALFFKIQKEKTAIDQKQQTAESLRTEVEAIELKISKLEPLKGWEQFYNQTFNSQMAWDAIFSKLGSTVPKNVVLDSMAVIPDKVNNWSANISGQIRSMDWETGLKELRLFGSRIDMTGLYRIKSINYAPKDLEEDKKIFNFQMFLEFK